MSELDELRERIKEIDADLVQTIRERVDIAARIGEAKTRDGKPIKNYHVEQQVIERFKDSCEDHGLLTDTGERIAEAVIREAVRQQENDRHTAQEDGDNYVIVGGEGNMGRWFQNYLRQGGSQVTTVDPDGGDHETLPSLHGYDAILLTTPIEATREVLNELRRRSPEADIADITSVKEPVSSELRACERDGLSVTSFHPLFGPDTRTLNRRNVVIASLGCQRADSRIQALFEETTATVTTIPFDNHDTWMTEVLALPHLVNLVFGVSLDATGTPLDDHKDLSGTTFRKQADTAGDVFNENPAVYHAIQHYADEGFFDRVCRSLTRIRDAADRPDPKEFEELMETEHEYFTRSTDSGDTSGG